MSSRKFLSAAFYVMALVLAVSWRAYFALVLHPASEFIYSDMSLYSRQAMSYCRHLPETISDSVFPPGMHMLLGGLFCLSGDWSLAEYFLLFSSIAALGVIWIFARLSGPASVARIAVLLAAVYSPFIDFSGYFMAETILLLLLLLASSFLFYGLFRSEAEESAARRYFALAVAGFIFGLSALMKTQGLATFVLSSFSCLLARKCWKQRLVALAFLVVGAAPIFLFSAERCTRLNEGRFCLLANNAGYNMLLGHSPGVRKINFVDHKRRTLFYFSSPTTEYMDFHKTITVPFGVYENDEHPNLARQQFEMKPAEVMEMSWFELEALFGRVPLWPTSDWAYPWYARFGNEIWLLAFFCPTMIFAIIAWRKIPSMLMSPLSQIVIPAFTALILCSILGVGEPRYRIPFDGYTIVVAAHAWVGLLKMCRGAGAKCE